MNGEPWAYFDTAAEAERYCEMQRAKINWGSPAWAAKQRWAVRRGQKPAVPAHQFRRHRVHVSKDWTSGGTS